MVENDNNLEAPDALILSPTIRSRLEAKLIEDQYKAHGIPYNYERQFPNPPEEQNPHRTLNFDVIIVSKYRAAVITQLLEEGAISYRELKQKLRESGITIPFMPEAFRMAYKEVFECLDDPEKLPRIKKEES